MYDNISLTLYHTEAPSTDLIAEVPCFLSDVAEHRYRTGSTITGSLNEMHVSVSPYSVKVGGSLSTYLLGSNVTTIDRQQTKEAVERLSDELHLPLHLSHVGRIDVAATIPVPHPVPSYYPYLGEMRYYHRLPTASTLYYQQKYNTLCMYDKAAEMVAKKLPIPQEYQGANLFRYERRFKGRVAKSLRVPPITASTLYDKEFYNMIVQRWLTDFLSIPKVTDVQQIDFSTMRTIKDFKAVAVAKFISDNGGQAAMLSQIKQAQKQGMLTKKQAQDLRRLVMQASTAPTKYTAPNSNTEDLTARIEEEAAKYLSH